MSDRDVAQSLALLIAVAAWLGFALPAAADELMPFGHSCQAQDGVRFCPTAALSERVTTFDGVPLDVDVTLPATGSGPFPTLVMLHGYLQSKTQFESSSADGTTSPAYHYNNVYYARRGYAVVNYSARGFGRSCGLESSRTSDCAHGWLHFGDQRHEVRDTQDLLGELVDEGIADWQKLGVTGLSYGGGQTMQLAFLKDRMRMPDGSLKPWRSPDGVSLKVRAAFVRWSWFDFIYAFLPNGRLIDTRAASATMSTSPIGALKQTMLDALYNAGAIAAYLAPEGVDRSADISSWRKTVEVGGPYGGKQMRAVVNELDRYHSSAGLSGSPAPLLIQNGWTDDIFPASEAVHAYQEARKRDHAADVSMMFGDFGHFRASNKPSQDRYFNPIAARFFDSRLGVRAGGKYPLPGSVFSFIQHCGTSAFTAPVRTGSWRSLRRRTITFGDTTERIIKPNAASVALSKSFDPAEIVPVCKSVSAGRVPAAMTYSHRSDGVTLVGMPTVRATVRVSASSSQLNVRLWDVAPAGRQVLVSRGVYRLAGRQKQHIRFQLQGNGYRIPAGHTIRLELVDSDPSYVLQDRNSYRVTVSDLKLSLPVR